jgi:hypothetical protein
VFPRERKKKKKDNEGLMCGAVPGWACAAWARPGGERVHDGGGAAAGLVVSR